MESLLDALFALLTSFMALSLSGKVMCLALGLLLFMALYWALPSRGNRKSSNSTETSSSKGKRSKAVSTKATKDKAYSKGTAVAATAATARCTIPVKKQGLISRLLFGKRPTLRPPDPNKLNETLDFLDPNPEKDYRDFKHGRVTDHFNELIKPGSVMADNIPDLDETDEIFTAMLRAGAVTGKHHLVTNYEHQYLEKLRMWFGERYHVYCQVSVGSAVQINADVSSLNLPQRRTFAQKCNNMSFDFMLIDKRTDRIVCAIELDDPTHKRIDRKMRDRRLDRVCKAANIPIFHVTNLYQKPDISRIRI